MGRLAMRWVLAWSLLAACSGGDGSSGDSGAGATAGSGAVTGNGSGGTEASGNTGTGTGSGAGGGSTGAGAGGTGGSGGAMTPAISVCLQACNTPADCANASPAYDTDNWACNGGGCVYLGCNSDAECAPSGLVCRQQLGLDICVLPCSVPADCDIGGGPSADADNYQCVMGGCIYQGCNTNAECAASPGGFDTCWDPGSGVKVCGLSCNAPADCVAPNALAPYDSDNYACDNNVCRYTGCNNSTECAALGNYICSQP